MLNFNISNKQIVGSINSKPFSVPHTEELWNALTLANNQLASATTKAQYDLILEEAQKSLDTIEVGADYIETITPNIVFDKKKGTYHLATADGNLISDIALPKILIEKMKYADSNNLPVTPIVKFATRLLRNPRARKSTEEGNILFERVCNYVFRTYVDPTLLKFYIEEKGFSNEVATEMSTIYQTPITQEGLISTKKVVEVDYDAQRFKFVKDDEDFASVKQVLRDGITSEVDENTAEVKISDPQYIEDWKFYPTCMGKTGGDAWSRSDLPEGETTHYYRIGTYATLQPSQVDYNDNHSCSKGLHTGNFDYVKNWVRDNNYVAEVFVDPEKIAAIPLGDSSGVLRVEECYFYGQISLKVPMKNIYHSSTYAAKTDAAWAETLEAAIKESEAKEAEAVAQFKAEREKLNALR